MSKKITSFLLLLVTMFISTNVMAQDDIDLDNKSITVGEVVESFEPNTWYFLHQGRDTGIGTGQYAPALVGEIPSSGGFLYDNGLGENILKPGVSNVDFESSAKAKAGFLVRFIPTGNEGAYNIQFGTGNWMTAPASDAQSAKFSSTDNIYDAGEFNIYYIDPETAPGTVGINVYDMKWRLDNNFAGSEGINTGNTVVTWGSGKHETVLNDDGMIVSNSIWSIVAVQWGELEALAEAIRELEDTYAKYAAYSGTFEVGDAPGQYGEEEVLAFEAALLEAYDAGEEAQDPATADQWTVERLKATAQAVIDTYNAVLASQVRYNIASGYYFIRNGYSSEGVSNWYETVTNEAGEEETVNVFKYMKSGYSGETIVGTWGSVDREDVGTTAPALWIVTAEEDGTYDIVNAVTKGRFNNVAQSTTVTMDPASENRMAIDYVGTCNDEVFVDIRVSTQAAKDFLYLHPNGHSTGAGHSGNLVGWSCGHTSGTNDFGATEWVFEPISEEEALQILKDYEPYQNREKMVESYKAMVADAQAKIEIAKDIQISLDEENPLVTDVSQFFSPYTETREGSIDALIDGDASTFWHSDWSSSVPAGTHYLQVEMPDVEVANAAFQFTRRNVANDHITVWGVMGTNEFEAEKDACELLATINTPKNANDETLVSDVFETKGYKYLRFYAENTTGNGSATRGYFHLAEFQLYPAEVLQSETCQYNVMGDLVKNLEGVIAEQAEIEDADLTLDNYNKLKEAYDAFIEKFVDPAELRETLATVEEKSASIVTGTQPGFWTDKSTGDALDKTIADAKAYDAAGDYTPAASADYVEKLKAQAETVTTSAIGISTSKWYKIRFADEEMFEKYGWDKVAGEAQVNEAAQTETSPELFGKYIVASLLSEEKVTYEDANGNNQTISVYEMEPATADELSVGSKMHFMAADAITEPDMALFRFVAVGDSAYLLQNKGTGLFVKAAGTSGDATLSVHPSLFDVRAIGYGLNVIPARSIKGEKQSYLHAQVLQNVLVTWDVDYPGSRSGLLIEEAEDVAADFDGTEFNMAVLPGSFNGMCYPMDLSVKEGENATMWTVESVDVENNAVTLTKITKGANGGRPFILVHGAEFDPEATADETEMVVMKHNYAVTATEPQAEAALKGVFAETKVGAGVLVPYQNTLTVSKQSSTKVAANGAYVSGDAPYDLQATFEVKFGDGEDAIQTIISNATRTGAIYTLDGRIVTRKGNINSLQRGIYIINGTRVVIK